MNGAPARWRTRRGPTRRCSSRTRAIRAPAWRRSSSGRLRMDRLNDMPGAVQALEQAVALAPGAELREDALARLVAAAAAAHDHPRCARARTRYLTEYPPASITGPSRPRAASSRPARPRRKRRKPAH